jgi:hypothetical protein
VQVFQVVETVAFQNLGVVAADGDIIEDDLTIGMSPHYHPFSAQLDDLFGNFPFEYL